MSQHYGTHDACIKTRSPFQGPRRRSLIEFKSRLLVVACTSTEFADTPGRAARLLLHKLQLSEDDGEYFSPYH
jgi:hypothetical protein